MPLGKGDRIRVTSGRKSMDATGTIFWVGDNSYGEGNRFGVHGDDGETHWVAEENCDPWTEAAPEATGPELNKGDRVQWTVGDDVAQGGVFWLGANKYGGGTRVGVKDDDGETHWFDSRKLTLADRAAPRREASEDRWGATPPPPASPGDDADVWDGAPMASSPDTPPVMDEPPPIDDDFAYAGQVDAEEIYDDDVPLD